MEKEFNFKVKFQLEVRVNFKGGLMWPHLRAELKQYEARKRGQNRSNGLWGFLQEKKKDVNCARSASSQTTEPVPPSGKREEEEEQDVQAVNNPQG